MKKYARLSPLLFLTAFLAQPSLWAGGRIIPPPADMDICNPEPLELQRLMEGVYRKGKPLAGLPTVIKTFTTTKLPDLGSKAKVTVFVEPLMIPRLKYLPPYQGPIPPNAAERQFTGLQVLVEEKSGSFLFKAKVQAGYAAIFSCPNSPTKLSQATLTEVWAPTFRGPTRIPGTQAKPFIPFVEQLLRVAVRAVARAK